MADPPSSPNLMYTYSGACHCGAIEVELNLTKPAAAIPVRACQCSFCRRRGTRTVADAAGLATIRASSSIDLERYRFGLSTADYLICKRCGIYVAAVQHDARQLMSVVNVAGLDVPAFRDRAGEAVSYEGETVPQRLARRRTYWMPTVLEIAGQ
jgi:hypothetical protein